RMLVRLPAFERRPVEHRLPVVFPGLFFLGGERKRESRQNNDRTSHVTRKFSAKPRALAKSRRHRSPATNEPRATATGSPPPFAHPLLPPCEPRAANPQKNPPPVPMRLLSGLALYVRHHRIRCRFGRRGRGLPHGARQVRRAHPTGRACHH